MKKIALAFLAILVVASFAPLVFAVNPDTGFNEYGYNYGARIFVGTAESWGYARGWDSAQIDDYFGIYRYDKLVMKWNDEWDRGNAESWTDDYYAAWCTNYWNGKVPGGSGEMGTFMCIWVGADGEASEYWRDGGYMIWGQFEVVMEKYFGYGEPMDWWALATPSGLGGI